MWVIAGQYGMHAYVVMLLSCSGLGGIRVVHYEHEYYAFWSHLHHS